MSVGILFTVMFLVILYDYAQAVFDLGYNEVVYKNSLYEFFYTNFPYIVLHSFISVLVAFVAIVYLVRRILFSENILHNSFWIFAMAVVVFISPLFYSIVRLKYTFDTFIGLDYVFFVVSLNVISSIVAFGAAELFVRRQEAYHSMGKNRRIYDRRREDRVKF